MSRECRVCKTYINKKAIRQMSRWIKIHPLSYLDKEQEDALLKAIFSEKAERVSKEEFNTIYKR